MHYVFVFLFVAVLDMYRFDAQQFIAILIVTFWDKWASDTQ